jgi:hypothetical protein
MIEIAGRLRPFSHQPGCLALIPGTGYLVEAYPTLIRITDLKRVVVKEVAIDVQGPLKQFTAMQDLERGCITLFSELYRVHVLPNLEISFRKNPPCPAPASQERLACGSHKKQEWGRIRYACDFSEIFPLWFRLGSLLTLPPRLGDNRGTFSLLERCRLSLIAHRPEQIIPAFERLFLAGFGDLMVPRAIDSEFQGILDLQEAPSSDSPLYLLSEGAQLIRSLFLLQASNEVAILPNLPPELFAGRMLHISLPPFGIVDFEWSKKRIQRLQFFAQKDGIITFYFPPPLKHFRMRQTRNERGKTYVNGESLEIKSGSHYLLDQFQK